MGVAARVCLSSGQWSGDAPVCQGGWSLNLTTPICFKIVIKYMYKVLIAVLNTRFCDV